MSNDDIIIYAFASLKPEVSTDDIFPSASLVSNDDIIINAFASLRPEVLSDDIYATARSMARAII